MVNESTFFLQRIKQWCAGKGGKDTDSWQLDSRILNKRNGFFKYIGSIFIKAENKGALDAYTVVMNTTYCLTHGIRTVI